MQKALSYSCSSGKELFKVYQVSVKFLLLGLLVVLYDLAIEVVNPIYIFVSVLCVTG